MKEIIRNYDIHPVRRFGQNFLTDHNIRRKIGESLPVKQGRTFIEIGPGLGAITGLLLKKGERVISIEIDKKLQAYLENELAPKYPNSFELVKGDVLEVLTEDFFRERNVYNPVLIGNLPYYISSPILFRALELSHLTEGCFFTLQKEFADRLVAKPGRRDYGRLSASFGCFANVKKIFDIAPGCFVPKPDIWSTFLCIEFKDRYRDELTLRDEYIQLVKVAFSERRKQLIGLLSKNYGLKAKESEDCMIRLGLAPRVRAEELSPVNFWKLLEIIDKHKKKL